MFFDFLSRIYTNHPIKKELDNSNERLIQTFVIKRNDNCLQNSLKVEGKRKKVLMRNLIEIRTLEAIEKVTNEVKAWPRRFPRAKLCAWVRPLRKS